MSMVILPALENTLRAPAPWPWAGQQDSGRLARTPSQHTTLVTTPPQTLRRPRSPDATAQPRRCRGGSRPGHAPLCVPRGRRLPVRGGGPPGLAASPNPPQTASGASVPYLPVQVPGDASAAGALGAGPLRGTTPLSFALNYAQTDTPSPAAKSGPRAAPPRWPVGAREPLRCARPCGKRAPDRHPGARGMPGLVVRQRVAAAENAGTRGWREPGPGRSCLSGCRMRRLPGPSRAEPPRPAGRGARHQGRRRGGCPSPARH